ncbi:TNT domain-containing protein [Xenorhabdus bovienii]|uniref:TNT domain-containing protein n=1 Tax=Xenorhabdus bovienii TaxID=40576 RepID=UPI003DA3473C
MNPYGYVYNPAKWVDPFGLAGTSVVNHNSWNKFQSRSTGMFSSRAEAAKAYHLWKKQDWAALEKMMPPGAWPPNSGFVHVTPTTLQPGTKIDRYGGWYDKNGVFNDTGTFVAPAGATFESRALQQAALEKPYKVYEVIKPIKADSGPAIPWFGQKGMGMQHDFKPYGNDIQTLLDGSFIKEIP